LLARSLRRAAEGFHRERTQFDFRLVGVAPGLSGGIPRLLGADFRAHDPAAELQKEAVGEQAPADSQDD
jgi:hypothetical protein